MPARASRRHGRRQPGFGPAYIDESQRGGRYLVAAVAIEVGSVHPVRRALGLVRPAGGQARRHFAKESDAQRRKLLGHFRALPGVKAFVVDAQGGGSSVDKRERCLTAIVRDLLTLGVGRLVFDHVDPAQLVRDRQVLVRVLRGSGVTYVHEIPHTTEPMSWVPDAVAWCAGAKPEWRAQLDGWVAIHQV